jgi:hypothetical protein
MFGRPSLAAEPTLTVQPLPGSAVQDDPAAVEVAERKLPTPTVWPCALALGLTSLCFGIIASGIFFYVGVIVVALAIVGWMRELMFDRRDEPLPNAMAIERVADRAEGGGSPCFVGSKRSNE